MTEDVRLKIKKSNTGKVSSQKKEPCRCSLCGKKILPKTKTGMCFTCAVASGALKTSNSFRRNLRITRSKNEIEFASLCKTRWDYVFENPKMFEGYDADIVLLDQHVAILWNGIHHYIPTKGGEKNLEDVQRRDKEKIESIIKCGFKPYIIKDEGRADSNFVSQEFDKLTKYIL